MNSLTIEWNWEYEEAAYVCRYRLAKGLIVKYLIRGPGSDSTWTVEVWHSRRKRPTMVFNYIKTKVEAMERAVDNLETTIKVMNSPIASFGQTRMEPPKAPTLSERLRGLVRIA